MSNVTQLPLDAHLRELRKPVCRSSLQVVALPVEIVPAGHDECWQAFLHLTGTSEPIVHVACPGVSDGVPLHISFIQESVLEGRGFPFFGPFDKPYERSCSADDALLILRAVVKAIPATAGEFRLGWVPHNPSVPF